MTEPDYARFTLALASRDGQPEVVFAALHELAQRTVGVKLFTLMTIDAERGLAQRVYSNRPEAFPVAGTKPLSQTAPAWSRRVVTDQQTFVANDIESMVKVFDDSELIRSLGCESVINVPVVVAGETMGTINCLHAAGFYTEDKVRAAEALKLPAAASFLLNLRLAGADDRG